MQTQQIDNKFTKPILISYLHYSEEDGVSIRWKEISSVEDLINHLPKIEKARTSFSDKIPNWPHPIVQLARRIESGDITFESEIDMKAIMENIIDNTMEDLMANIKVEYKEN